MSATRTLAAKTTDTQLQVEAATPAVGSKAKAGPTPRKPSTRGGKPVPKTQAAVAAADKDAKAKKPKLVRDSFTIPKDEYAVIESLKQRTARLSLPAKKSELLRAGLKLLAALDDAALRQAMQTVPTIKTGRPKADKK
ncbi:MAG: hypothetical protein JSR23_00340 [Proteobacteria bacterium]|nr:hypothetical protein [Pseudomonadota bacterium]